MPYGPNPETSLPITFNLTGEDAILQNRRWRREFCLQHLDAGGNLVPWNLTGHTMYCSIRATPDGPIILELTPFYGRGGAGLFGPAPDQYNLWIELQPSDTMGTARAALEAMGLGLWQLDIISPSGVVEPAYEGQVALSRSVNY